MFPLLLIGGLVLFALTRETERKPTAPRPPPAERSLFSDVGGVLEYVPEVAHRILFSYSGRAWEFGPASNVIIIHPAPAQPGQLDAFTALFQAHADGLDIYVPTNAHVPIAIPVPVLFLDPDAPPPVEGMARLIRANQPFPPISVGVV